MAGAADQLRGNGTSDYGAAKSKLQTIVGNGGIVPFETSIRSLTNLLRCRRLPNATCRYWQPRRLTEDLRSDRTGFNKTNPQMTHLHKDHQ